MQQLISQRLLLQPSLTSTITLHSACEARGAIDETLVAPTTKSAQKRYSATTAARVIGALQDLERVEDVVTISAIARRTGVSRPTVRAVLQQECGWTATHSRRAHYAGVRRGKLLQALAGHPGLAQGRATLQIQGWPNLQRAQQAARASAYPALQRGRETQAALGWPGLKAVHHARATTGYPHLAQGRANLAARGWPNWQRAQDVLKAQDYLPLLDAQRLGKSGGSAPQTDPQTDRRRLRGRATRLAILEALQACRTCEDQCAPDPTLGAVRCGKRPSRDRTRARCSTTAPSGNGHAHLKWIKLLAT